MTSPETEGRSESKKGLGRELLGWLAFAAGLGAIVALLGYVFFLEQGGAWSRPLHPEASTPPATKWRRRFES